MDICHFTSAGEADKDGNIQQGGSSGAAHTFASLKRKARCGCRDRGAFTISRFAYYLNERFTIVQGPETNDLPTYPPLSIDQLRLRMGNCPNCARVES